MAKKTINIGFCDFGFPINDDSLFPAFLNRLRDDFDFVVQKDFRNADYVLYSCFGQDHLECKGIRIFYTGECQWANYSACDYALTFSKEVRDDGRHCRLPYYFWTMIDQIEAYEKFRVAPDIEKLLEEKLNFCSFIYSNPGCGTRNKLFHKLSKYKFVHSGGRFLNNIGGPVADKFDFIRKSKFTFAFENRPSIGYVTEKLIEPILCESLPLYWGCPEVPSEINPRRYLNFRDYDSMSDYIDRIIEIDNDDSLYASYFEGELFTNNAKSQELIEPVLNFLRHIFLHGEQHRHKNSKLFYSLKRSIYRKKMPRYWWHKA